MPRRRQATSGARGTLDRPHRSRSALREYPPAPWKTTPATSCVIAGGPVDALRSAESRLQKRLRCHRLQGRTSARGWSPPPTAFSVSRGRAVGRWWNQLFGRYDWRLLRVIGPLPDCSTEPLLDPQPNNDLVAQLVLAGDLLGQFQEIWIHSQ
jgi:hypothetical protein